MALPAIGLLGGLTAFLMSIWTAFSHFLKAAVSVILTKIWILLLGVCLFGKAVYEALRLAWAELAEAIFAIPVIAPTGFSIPSTAAFVNYWFPLSEIFQAAILLMAVGAVCAQVRFYRWLIVLIRG